MCDLIFWILACLLSTFSFSFLFYGFSNASKKLDWKVFALFTFGVIIQTFIQYYNLTLLSILSYFIFFPIFLYCINPMSVKSMVYYLMIVWFYAILVDIILILMISLLSYVLNFSIYNNYYDYSWLFTIILSIILIVIGRLKIVKNQVKLIYCKMNNLKYYDTILVLFSISVIFMGVTMLINVKNLNLNVLLMLVIFLTVVTFVALIKCKIIEEENYKYLKNLKENNEFYIKLDDENRIFRHNLNGKLLSIKSVSNKKAISLIDDLISQFNKSSEFSNKMKAIPYGFNGIIYQKVYPYLGDLDIKINNSINYDIFDILNPRRYNVLIEKMNVVLDNAIESCVNSDDKILVISIFDNTDNIFIEIRNSFSDIMNVDLIGNKEYSTKGHRRGLGLFSILRNNEASLSVKIVNNFFISKIRVKKYLQDLHIF